jgi:hypothetical protein
MVYRFWEWYDSIIGTNLRFLIFIIMVAPFIIGIGYPRGSTFMLAGLGWVCLLVVTRMYYALRKQMDEETRRQYGTRHSRK